MWRHTAERLRLEPALPAHRRRHPPGGHRDPDPRRRHGLERCCLVALSGAHR
jgi:hypothetical protein